MNPTAHLPLKEKIRLARRNFEHRIRDLLLLILKAILCRASRQKSVLNNLENQRSHIRKVLIIRTGKAMGDAIISIVLIPECRRLFPGCRLDLLLRDSVSSLLKDRAGVDEVIELPSRFLKQLCKTWRLIYHSRFSAYDLVIACDNPYKSSFTTLCLALWTGARFRLGFDNEESRAFLNMCIISKPRDPMINNLLRLLSPFGEMPVSSVPKLLRLKTDAEHVNLLSGAFQPILIFAPHHWRKSWPLEVFLKMATELTYKKYHVILAFGPADSRMTDKGVELWLSHSNGFGKILPSQSLGIFAAILTQCRLFISNDCGPYHLAVSLGVPSIGIFLSEDNWREFGYEETGRFVRVYHPEIEKAQHSALNEALMLLSS